MFFHNGAFFISFFYEPWFEVFPLQAINLGLILNEYIDELVFISISSLTQPLYNDAGLMYRFISFYFNFLLHPTLIK